MGIMLHSLLIIIYLVSIPLLALFVPKLALAIDFNLKVGMIFIEENFPERCFTTIHHPSFFNGLSIFLLKLSLDFSFVIIGNSNHDPFAFPLETFPK